jgi:large subunit ribosomal protein L2
MALKHFKPTTPSQRELVLVDRSALWKGKPVKTLTEGLNKSGGRNNQGRVTIWSRGGGHKRRYRMIDFKRRKFDMPATVERLEYDPNRTAFIALIRYADGELSYIVAPQRLRVGDSVISAERADIVPGNAMPMQNIPVGTIIHNIEMKPGKGGQLCRAAGSSARLMAREGKLAQLKLPSGETRQVQITCLATIGQVGNVEHENISIGKAGRSRWLGRRGNVRGVAMNPVDHPHGGGEGRSSGGRHPVTPWGVPTKGYKTRKKKNPSNKFIVKRRGKK